MQKPKKEATPHQPPATTGSTLPVSWEEEMARQAAAAKAMEPMQGRFISLRGGVMTFQQQPLPGNKLNAIVIDSVIEHQLYEGAFDPNSAASPSCFAFGRVSQDMVPHATVEKKQSEKCATCPKFAWGSDPKGGRGKACREVRRLALIDGNLIEKGPEAITKAEVVFMKIPVTSVRNWASYVSQLANVVRRAPWGVVTEIAPQPDPKTMFLVKFALASQFGADILSAVAEKRKQLGDEGIMFPYKGGGNAQPEDPKAAADKAAADAKRRAEAKY